MQSENISLASRYIQYAMSTASSGRNNQLAALSQEEFMAISPEERDISWLGHCINRCPGYKMETDMAEAVSDFVYKNHSTTNKVKRFNTRLEENPQTYTAPFPVMWLEWEGEDDGVLIRNGILVENLDVGIKVTMVALNQESGVYPTIYTPIPVAYGTPKDMQTARVYTQDTPAHLNRETIEAHPKFHQEAANEGYRMALCALSVLNSCTDIKLIPATEFINQQAAMEGEKEKNPNAVIKPLGSLVLKPTGNLKFQTGNIVEIMRQEQQELTSILGVRKMPAVAPAVMSPVKPSKPTWLTRVKDVFAKSQETSLASQYIRYGTSTGSEERNAALSMASLEELLAVPREERDHAWFAHCIQKSPGYAGDESIMAAILAFEKKAYSDNTTRNRIERALIRQPELYTPPVPALWMEFESGDDDLPKMAYLLERLPGNKPGLQGTAFFLRKAGGVMPQKGQHMVHFTTESSDGNFASILYRDNIPVGKPQSERDLAFARNAAHVMHVMLALNDPSQPLKLMPSSRDSAGVADKPLGVVALSGPSITLDIAKALPNPEEKTPIIPPSAEPAAYSIARKQAWFDRPGLVLIARELDGEELSMAMGIKNYDAGEVKKIREFIDLDRNTHGFDIGAEVLGTLKAIDAAHVQLEYKRTFLFTLMLNLSKISDDSFQEIDSEMRNVKADIRAIQDITNRPEMISMGEGWGWKKLLRDKQMRRTAFDHVKKYDLVAPFYFLLNSKHTHAPEGSAEIFSQWCQSQGINLQQALIDYEPIDIGGPEPEIDIGMETILEKQGTSFASQFIDYAISTGSEERNSELSTLSTEELLAVPREERDHAWFARCVQKIPGYVGDANIMDAILAFEKETYSDHAIKRRLDQVLSGQPQLFTPPVPALWMEFEFGDSGVSKLGHLIERLPGNKQGFQCTQFYLFDDSQIMPQKGRDIFHFTAESSNEKFKVIRYKNNIPLGKPRTKDDRESIRNMIRTVYFMLALNDPSQPLKLTPPSENPAGTTDKSLGLIELNGPSMKLDSISAPPEPATVGTLGVAEKIKEKESAPKATVLNGTVIQRIFREAGKSHRNNSAEREDDIARMGWLSGQLQALGSLESMNANFEPHGALAEILFGDDVMRALEFSHLLPNGKKTVPAVPSTIRDNLGQRLKKVFSIAGTGADIQPDDLARNEKLKERILQFPGLVIAGMGGEGSLTKARDQYNIPLLSNVAPYAERSSVGRVARALERNESAREMLMNATGIELPAIETEEQLSAEIPPDEESQEDIEEQSPAEILPDEEPQEDIEAQASAEISSTEELQEENEQPENQTAEAAQTEEGVQIAKVFSDITAVPNAEEVDTVSSGSLSEDEELEKLLRYDEAFNKTEERLLADAQMYLMRALNRGCNQFTCFIDLKNSGFAIHLRFSGEVIVEGEKRTRKEFYVLDKYDEAYKDLDIPLTLENAVDLKISVQSMILNTEGIVPTHNVSTPGSSAVALDTQMPLPILDYSIAQRSGGMYALIYEAKDPYTKKLIYPSIPLGFAARYEDEAAEQQELEERTTFIIDYLHKVGNQRTPEGYRTHVYKRDVMAKLQSWLQENNKEWETADRIELPGFEASTLVHVFSQSNQKITLAPISLALDAGGENPSWHCALPFYIGDKDKPSMGELVRTRSFNLRTRSSRLALARTLESLLGVKNKVVQGLLPALQQHMRATENEWRVEKGEKGDEVFIGSIKLQDFLDDMMRYERDIGIKLKKREEGVNGDIIITLQALRCLVGDFGGTVKPAPEYVHEKHDDTRKPVAFTLVVPRDKADSIDTFVQKVHSHISWLAEESYSSVALGKDGQPDKRKSPLEYRTAQIRNALIRAVEAMYESHFGRKLSRNWYKPEMQSAFSSEPVHEDTPVVGLG